MHKICKMKKIVFILFLTNFSFAQVNSKEGVIDLLSNQTCDCLNTKDLTETNLELTLGVCIIQSIQKNKEEVEKYFGKNILSDEDNMTEIAESIGVQLALECSKFTNLISDMTYEDEAMDEEYLSYSGKIIAVNSDQFMTFKLKQDSGKIVTFLVLEDFDNSYLLLDSIIQPTEKVEVSYYEATLYDAKIKKFVPYNVVLDIIKQ